jgi:O-antigen/teichoic acid export membrane protein
MLTFGLLWMDMLLMGYFRESREVGVYGLCARLAPAVALVPESLGPVFTAQLSRLFVERDWDSIRRLYRFTTRWAIWPAHTIGWILVLWSEPILSVFGREFRAGATALVLLAAAKAVSASGGHCGKVLAMTDRAGFNLFNTGVAVAVNLGLNLLWIPRFGGAGAAAATCCCLLLSKTLQVIEVRIFYRMLPWDVRGLAGVAAPALVAAALFPFRDGLAGPWGWLLPLGVYVLAATAAYLALGIGEEDRAVWRAMRRRIAARRPA